MMEGTGSLEQQLATLRQRAGEVRARRADLRRLEELGKIFEVLVYYLFIVRVNYLRSQNAFRNQCQQQ